MRYIVTININGFIGCDEEYEVEADSVEEAEEIAIDEALSTISLDVIDVSEVGDD